MCSAIALPLTATDCLGWFARAAKPRKARTVSQWADEHRVVSGKQSGERGQWRTARTPFLREIMDCLSAGSPVTDIVVMKSSQVGVTEATVNWIGYVMEHAPAPMMVLMPTLESRDSWKTQKLNPLLQETPAVRDVLGGLRSRDAANRQDLIDFPGGVLFLAGGNSANSYAQKSVRNLVLDDLDRFPPEIGDEGDVVTLAKGRTKAFARAKRLFISTPTVKGESLIEREWDKSDQRRFHITCPECGHSQPLEWGGEDVPHGLKWNKVQNADGEGVVREAWYACRACLHEIREHQKPALLAAGHWVPTYPHRSVRGYHISALYAPIGLGPSWVDLANGWLEAQKSTETLRAFVNTDLGEPWEERTDGIDPMALMTRLETYPANAPRRVRSVGIDVQKDRIEMSVYDYWVGEEGWAIDHIIVEGDTAGPAPWVELADEIAALSPDCGGIDSGYNTDMVYKFAASRTWLFVMKGIEGRGKTLVESDEDRKRRLRKKRKKGFSPFLVSDAAGKALLMQRLSIDPPTADDQTCAGYIHFPQGVPAFDDEFFAQLTSWRLDEKVVRGRLSREWKQAHVRDESYDCWKYALAGLRLSKIDLAARAARAVSRETPKARATRGAAKPPSAGGGFGSDDWIL